MLEDVRLDVWMGVGTIAGWKRRSAMLRSYALGNSLASLVSTVVSDQVGFSGASEGSPIP